MGAALEISVITFPPLPYNSPLYTMFGLRTALPGARSMGTTYHLIPVLEFLPCRHLISRVSRKLILCEWGPFTEGRFFKATTASNHSLHGTNHGTFPPTNLTSNSRLGQDPCQHVPHIRLGLGKAPSVKEGYCHSGPQEQPPEAGEEAPRL